MATYGEIRRRLAQQHPGVDLPLLDGWILDRYQEILDSLPWRRIERLNALQTVAPYETGTVNLTNGDMQIVGVGTAWAEAMTGRMFRLPGSQVFYEFHYGSETTAMLDRPYEGDTVAGAAYALYQHVYPLPATIRIVQSIWLNTDLDRKGYAELQGIHPSKAEVGTPRMWAPAPDNIGDPPQQQIEVYPVPDRVYTLHLKSISDADGLVSGRTALGILPWIRPGAIIQGVHADILAHEKDYAGAAVAETKFQQLVSQLRAADAEQRGGTALKMDPYYTAHNARRWSR